MLHVLTYYTTYIMVFEIYTKRYRKDAIEYKVLPRTMVSFLSLYIFWYIFQISVVIAYSYVQVYQHIAGIQK